MESQPASVDSSGIGGSFRLGLSIVYESVVAVRIPILCQRASFFCGKKYDFLPFEIS
jgi:hypothetical protein